MCGHSNESYCVAGQVLVLQLLNEIEFDLPDNEPANEIHFHMRVMHRTFKTDVKGISGIVCCDKTLVCDHSIETVVLPVFPNRNLATNVPSSYF